MNWDAPLPPVSAAMLRKALAGVHFGSPGSELADIATVVGIGRPSERERLDAARRVHHHLGCPVHRTRWPDVFSEVEDMVGTVGHEATLGAELAQHVAVEILGLAQQTLGQFTPAEIAEDPTEAHRILWQRLNLDLPEALCGGPEWRKVPPATYRGPARPNALAQVEARIDVELLLARANLSPQEAAIVASYLAGSEPKEISEEQNNAVKTIYVHLHNARRKLRRAAGL
jgi:hypothetical protein